MSISTNTYDGFGVRYTCVTCTCGERDRAVIPERFSPVIMSWIWCIFIPVHQLGGSTFDTLICWASASPEPAVKRMTAAAV